MQQDWRSEPTQEENGHYSTCAPQDIFCMLDQQLDVAFKRRLEGQVRVLYHNTFAFAHQTMMMMMLQCLFH